MLYKIGANTLASSLGRIIGSAFALVSVALMTRALGAEGFGEYSTVVAYLTTFQILADLGLYSLFTREISQNPARERELLGIFFTLRLLAGAFLLALAVVLVFFFPYSHGVQVGVAFASIGFLAVSLTQLFMGVFQTRVAVYKGAIAEVAGRAVQLVLVAFFATRGGGLFSFIVALVLSSFVIFFLNLLFAWRIIPFRLSLPPVEAKRIIRTTLPIAISIVFTLLYFRVDTLMLSVLKGPIEVGLYNGAYKVLETFIFFPAVLVGLFLPILSRQAQDDRRAFSRTLSVLADGILVIVAPLVVGGVLLSASMVALIGGAEFIPAFLSLAILFGAVGMIFFGTLFGNSVVALNLQKKSVSVYAIGFVVNFGANLFVIPRYSYTGAAWTTLGTELLVTILLALLVWRAAHFTFSLRAGGGALGASAFMAFVLWNIYAPWGVALGWFEMVQVVVLGAFLYSVASLAFIPSLWERAKKLQYQK